MSESALPDGNLVFHGNGGTFPPHGVITAIDHGPSVVVASWIFMCLQALTVLARVGSRQNFQDSHTLAICAASVLAIVQTTAIHLAADYGLGRHITSLSDEEYTSYSKALYASQILEIFVYYLTKLSLLLLLLRLTPYKRLRQTFWLSIIILTLWTVAAVISHAVQCPLPQPWNVLSHGCRNLDAIYLTYGTINIVTDLTIISFPVILLWDVQIKTSQKLAIYSVFVIRVLVCITVAFEMASLDKYNGNPDKSWSYVDAAIWGQASMNLSIITACIPSMRPLFNMLQFSLIDSAIPLLPVEKSGKSYPSQPKSSAKSYPSQPKSSTEDKLISVEACNTFPSTFV